MAILKLSPDFGTAAGPRAGGSVREHRVILLPLEAFLGMHGDEGVGDDLEERFQRRKRLRDVGRLRLLLQVLLFVERRYEDFLVIARLGLAGESGKGRLR